MKYFLTSSATKLFILFFAIPFFCYLLIFIIPLIQVTTGGIEAMGKNFELYATLFYFVAIIILVSAMALLFYFWSIGVNLHKRITKPAFILDKKVFSVIMFFLVSFLILSIYLFQSIYNEFNGYSSSYIPSSLIDVLYLLKFLVYPCIFFVLVFVAKALVTIEKGMSVSFKQYVLTLLLLFLLPIGIWFIQPRVNKIFK